jgi:hypothetical protein
MMGTSFGEFPQLDFFFPQSFSMVPHLRYPRKMETPELMRHLPSRDNKVNYHRENHLGLLGWSISTSVFFFFFPPVMHGGQFGYTSTVE